MSSPQALYDGSIGVNPRVADIDINSAATDFLWAVFAIMLLSDLVFIFLAFRRPVGTRLFHQLPILILTTASIAYFSMASDLGATAIRAEYPRGAGSGVTRSIWYVRYIDWTITTPLLLLELLLMTGLPLSDILTVIFMDLAMIVCGLVGALVASRYKWGYFAFGCAAQFYILWVLCVRGPNAAGALGTDVRAKFRQGAYALMFVWLLYPIAWGVADGGNVISPLKEMIFYGILDVIAKPVFCFYHAFSIRSIAYERYGLQSGKATVGLAGGEKLARESTDPLVGQNRTLGPNTGAAGAGAAVPMGPVGGRTGLTQRVSGRGHAEMGDAPVTAAR